MWIVGWRLSELLLAVEHDSGPGRIEAEVLRIAAHERARIRLARESIEAVLLERAQLTSSDAGHRLDRVEPKPLPLPLSP